MSKVTAGEQRQAQEKSSVLLWGNALRGNLLLAALTGLLIAFSVWCVILFWRSHELRSDLDHHLGWIEDLRQLRGDLDRPRPAAPGTGGGDLSYPADWSIGPTTGSRRGGPELRVAVQGLRGALERLRASLDSEQVAPESGQRNTADAIWEAAAAARGAVTNLEERILTEISALRISRRSDVLPPGLPFASSFFTVSMPETTSP